MKGSVFRSKQIVVARTERDRQRLESIITRNGGKISKRLSRKSALFVHSHSSDDDSRLANARKLGITIVSAKYIAACIGRSKLLNPLEFACGSKPWSALRVTLKDLCGLFRPPLDHWREWDEELPQCYDEFEDNTERIRVEEQERGQKTLYILPFKVRPGTKKSRGAERNVHPKTLEAISQYLQIFFSMKVKTLPAHLLSLGIKTAGIFGSQRSIAIRMGKLNALHLIDFLYEEFLPMHPPALLVLAVVPEPIFDTNPATVIYGRATGDGGCVLSTSMLAEVNEESRLPPGVLRNLLGTPTHELMHCLGLDHCAFFGCVLNACCDPDAEDGDEGMPPLYLCPVDTRKLQTGLAWPDSEIGIRCDRLKDFYSRCSLEPERKFMEILRPCFV